MKNFKMPANYAAISTDEQVNMTGSGELAQICYAFGDMFRHSNYSKWDEESATLEQAHGAVVSKNGGVYTYSDGYTHTMTSGQSYSFNIGDFFYGLGRLFSVFGL